MAVTLGDALVMIKGDTGPLGDSFRKAEGETKGFVDKLGGTLLTGFKVGMAAVGASIAGAVALGAREIVGFDRQMREVFTLMPGMSADAMSAMTTDVRKFASEFGVLPDELVPALYQALSAGVPADNVFAFLETANMAAVGGVTDLETAVDGITSVMNAYGAEVLDATTASDLMFTAVRLGKTTFDEISASIFQVAPIASSLGVAFEDVTAAVASLTAQGVPTSVVMTQMRQLLVELSKEGGKASDAFKDAAGVAFRDFIAAGGSVADALELMESHAKANGLAINDLFSSVEAGNAALGLSGQNLDAYRANLDEMAASAGATDDAFNTMAGSLDYLGNQVKAAGKVIFGTIGEAVSPFIQAIGGATHAILDELIPGLDVLGREIAKELGWIADEATAWGQTIGEQLAAGLADAIPYILGVIRAIRRIFEYWFAPHSPPKIAEEIDEWGRSLMQYYFRAFEDADFREVKAFGRDLQGVLKDALDVGILSEEQAQAMMPALQSAFEKALDEAKTLGKVSEETFAQIGSAAGPIRQQVLQVARAFLETKEEAEKAAGGGAKAARDAAERAREERAAEGREARDARGGAPPVIDMDIPLPGVGEGGPLRIDPMKMFDFDEINRRADEIADKIASPIIFALENTFGKLSTVLNSVLSGEFKKLVVHAEDMEALSASVLAWAQSEKTQETIRGVGREIGFGIVDGILGIFRSEEEGGTKLVDNIAKSILQSNINAVSAWRQVGADFVSGIIEGIIEGFLGKDAMEKVRPVAESFGEEFMLNVLMVFNPFMGLVIRLKELDEEIARWLEDLKRTTDNETKLLLRGILDKMNPFQLDWGEAWDSAKSTVAQTWKSIIGDTDEKTGELNTNILAWLAGLIRNWDRDWETIKTGLKAKWDEMKSNTSISADEIALKIADTMKAIDISWATDWLSIKTVLVTTWNEIYTKVEETINKIDKWLRDNYLRIRDAATKPFRDAKTVLEGMLQDFFNLGVKLVDHIVEGILRFPEKVQNALGSVINRAIDAILRSLGIRDAAPNAVNAAGNIIGSLAAGMQHLARVPEMTLQQATAQAFAPVSHNYYLTAEYRYQDERTLRQEIELMRLLTEP